MSEIRFEAEVRGHKPPYRWKLYRAQTGVARVLVKKMEIPVEGEAHTFEEACFDAQAAAEEAYDAWLQENVKENVLVLTGPMVVPRQGSDDVPVVEPDREIRPIEPPDPEPETRPEPPRQLECMD